mgnify:CR=1 FL=1
MRRPFVVAGRLRPGRVLYPGSFSHVTASPVFPAVVDVDDDRSARRFCSRLDDVLSFVTGAAVMGCVWTKRNSRPASNRGGRRS